MKKKVLALVVLAAMLVSILPMAAFAAAGDLVLPSTEASNPVAANGSYKAEFAGGEIEDSSAEETAEVTISDVSAGLTVKAIATSNATVEEKTDNVYTVTAVSGDSAFKFEVSAQSSGTYSFKATDGKTTKNYSVVFTASAAKAAEATLSKVSVCLLYTSRCV